MDGAGDIFVGDAYGYPLVELPANGRAPIAIATPGISPPTQIVIDGAGDLFTFSSENSDFARIPAGGGRPIVLGNEVYIFGSLPVSGTAVNLNGDYYVALSDDYKDLISLLFYFPAAGGGPIFLTLPTPLEYIYGFGIGGGSELYLSYGTQVYKLPPGGGAPVTLPFTCSLSQLLVDGNGDVLTSNQELIPGASAAIQEPAALNLNNYPNVVTDSAANWYYGSLGFPASVYELQRSQLPTFDFGSVPVGGTKTLPLQFTNTGNETLIVTPSFESPSYSILNATSRNCLAGIAAGHTCTLEIQFAPQSAGPHSIELTLKNNGAADTVTLLEGTGTE